MDTRVFIVTFMLALLLGQYGASGAGEEVERMVVTWVRQPAVPMSAALYTWPSGRSFAPSAGAMQKTRDY